MEPFELSLKKLLAARGVPFADATRSHAHPDFLLPSHNLAIDVKEKRQHYSMTAWKEATAPEEHLFILDDLAVRRLLLHAPGSFLLIRDGTEEKPVFYVYSIVDLLCIPKKRVRRPIRRALSTFKGKWLVDLRDAAKFADLHKALDYILTFSKKYPAIFTTHLDCWGTYHSERIVQAGSTRIARYWKDDANTHG